MAQTKNDEVEKVTTDPVYGIPLTASGTKKLLADGNKGKLILEFNKPKFSYPQYISEDGYKDDKGKLHVYKNAAGEAETIVLIPPRTEFNLSDPQEKKKADFVMGFDPIKRFNMSAKYINTAKQAADSVHNKEKEYEVASKVARFIAESVHNLEALALNLGGIEVKGVDEMDVRAAVFSRVAKDPKKVEEAMADPDFQITAIIKKAAKLGVLTMKLEAYYYGERFLGANLKQTIAKLREDEDILIGIQRDMQV